MVGPDLDLARLRERHEDRLDLERLDAAAGEELIAELQGVDALFFTSRVKLTRDVLAETDLAFAFRSGTGLDNVDLAAARDHGVTVLYNPGQNAIAVAEHTVALALAASRRLVDQHEALGDGAWRDDLAVGTPRLLHGKTVGIVGFGNVGRRVASLLAGFHPELLAHDPYVEAIDAEPTGTELTGLDDLLDRADVVAVTAELTDETRGLIGADELARLHDDAILVVTSRGGIVEEAALIDALRADELGGAGLDVFETEPLPADSPLPGMENVITTPHKAGAAVESSERGREVFDRNVAALLAGESVPERYLAVP